MFKSEFECCRQWKLQLVVFVAVIIIIIIITIFIIAIIITNVVVVAAFIETWTLQFAAYYW